MTVDVLPPGDDPEFFELHGFGEVAPAGETAIEPGLLEIGEELAAAETEPDTLRLSKSLLATVRRSYVSAHLASWMGGGHRYEDPKENVGGRVLRDSGVSGGQWSTILKFLMKNGIATIEGGGEPGSRISAFEFTPRPFQKAIADYRLLLPETVLSTPADARQAIVETGELLVEHAVLEIPNINAGTMSESLTQEQASPAVAGYLAKLIKTMQSDQNAKRHKFNHLGSEMRLPFFTLDDTIILPPSDINAREDDLRFLMMVGVSGAMGLKPFTAETQETVITKIMNKGVNQPLTAQEYAKLARSAVRAKYAAKGEQGVLTLEKRAMKKIGQFSLSSGVPAGERKNGAGQPSGRKADYDYSVGRSARRAMAERQW